MVVMAAGSRRVLVCQGFCANCERSGVTEPCKIVVRERPVAGYATVESSLDVGCLCSHDIKVAWQCKLGGR